MSPKEITSAIGMELGVKIESLSELVGLKFRCLAIPNTPSNLPRSYLAGTITGAVVNEPNSKEEEEDGYFDYTIFLSIPKINGAEVLGLKQYKTGRPMISLVDESLLLISDLVVHR